MDSRTVIWPEGQPERARFQHGPLHSWWLSFLFGLRGLRTRRAWDWSLDHNPVDVARQCEGWLAQMRKHNL